MPRYLIERLLPAGFSETDVAAAARRIVAVNSAMEGVRWIHGNLAVDRTKLFDEYEATSAAALREAARLAEIPCDTITEVRELHPDAYTKDAW